MALVPTNSINMDSLRIDVSEKKWPHGGSSQSVAQLQRRVTTLKLTGTGGRTDGQDHVLSQADALTKNTIKIQCGL